MKKQNLLFFLVGLFLIGCSATPPIEPMVGIYEGDGISFILTDGGMITDFVLDGYLGNTNFLECNPMNFPQNQINENNYFNLNISFSGDEKDFDNFIRGKFSTNTTIEGTYYLQWCVIDGSVSMELSPYDGMHNLDWEANWVSE